MKLCVKIFDSVCYAIKTMVVNLRLSFVGRQLDGIWHTAIVAYGREYFFGPVGIQSVRPVSILRHWRI